MIADMEQTMRVQASEDTMDESAPTATLETIPR
ncbi:MAG: hypothetical protein QOJ69_2218, partial [Actinomycetota bacterium]|nr:hypothetical protein [Actinomycetota bacterium]